VSMKNKIGIFEVVANALDIDVIKLNMESSVLNLPQWDSFGIISIAVEIEKMYEINFVEEEIFGITSMEKLIDILKSKGING
jgi:acyl carrier protein